ncbi:MAG TPA: DUF3073 domain-containing protein [Candidatus Limnocylindria bacterium]|nr:DUF3073 domain-containing protein [Candidatus Limnocylindria bacterium]
MGRGRAKAKQTKVARDLKYNSGSMDLNRLRADLIHEDGSEVDPELLAKYEDLAAANGSTGSADADEDDEDDEDDEVFPRDDFATGR